MNMCWLEDAEGKTIVPQGQLIDILNHAIKLAHEESLGLREVVVFQQLLVQSNIFVVGVQEAQGVHTFIPLYFVKENTK